MSCTPRADPGDRVAPEDDADAADNRTVRKPKAAPVAVDRTVLTADQAVDPVKVGRAAADRAAQAPETADRMVPEMAAPVARGRAVPAGKDRDGADRAEVGRTDRPRSTGSLPMQ